MKTIRTYTVWNKNKTNIYSEETLKKMSLSKVGKPSWNKGIPCSEETKEKISLANKGRESWNKGISCSEETKEKISSTLTGRKLSEETKNKLRGNINWVGKKHTEETKEKISLANKGKNGWNKNIPMREESKIKLSNSLNGKIPWNKGKINIYNKETLERMRNMKKGIPLSLQHRINISGKIPWNKGKQFTLESKKKMSASARIRIEKQAKKGKFLKHNIGIYEKSILDLLEKSIGYKIIRQYPVKYYSVDGYCPMLNLIISINERYHFNVDGTYTKRHLRRKRIIERTSGCFVMDIDVRKLYK